MSKHVFADIPKSNIPRSVFRRNFNLKTTINVDYLYPIYVDEALPSDTFVFNQNLFARLTTPLTPIMDNLYLDTFYFAVPVRLVDKDFKKLMGERPFGDIRNDYVTPMLNSGTGVTEGSLSDYLGIPIKVADLDFSPWWHRAYALCYNEFFRDENLCPALPIAGVHDDGTVTTEALSDYPLMRRGKRKDYLTGCLPWPQKGASVFTPLGDSAPVFGSGGPILFSSADALSVAKLEGPASDTSRGAYGAARLFVLNPGSPYTSWPANSTAQLMPKSVQQSAYPQFTDSGAYADLTSATASTINQLREAFAVQHLLEQWARGGTRYIEIIRTCFNTISPDARQQRPEYLGGTSIPLNVNTVAQTSASTNTSPQGNLAAFVTASSRTGWTKSFTEHTLIIGIANIRADLSYQQGLPRMFSRKTKYDFYWPELANLGEQAVLNKEIYAQGNGVTDSDGNVVDDLPFGYQERWGEYRYHDNMITGQFRSTATLTLDYWHLAQKFAALPTLNKTFIEAHTPIDRVLSVATSNAPNMILDGWFELKCARPMPLYSVPGLSRL